MKRFLILTLFILTCVFSHAQNEAYLIPRKISVGDPAVLILPLSDLFRQESAVILTPLSPEFPSHPDIDFHRIILEERGGTGRLMIEFTAFIPGVLEFPEIEIGGLTFTDLSVFVDSVLGGGSTPALAAPASTLAMPGTALMIYGTIAGIILIILFSIWFVVKGRIIFNSLREKLKRRMLFSSMKKTEKRFSRSVLNGEDNRIILDDLSDQFRIFLSVLTGENCRTMTAGEFEKFSLHPVLILIMQHNDISRSFLHDFFRDCDDLRFSGIEAASQDIVYLLACLRRFIAAAENAEKEKVKNSVPAEKGEAA